MAAREHDTYLRNARLALDALQRWYSPGRGRWKTTGWWNAASLLTAVIRYARVSGDDEALGVLTQIYSYPLVRRPRSFINRYYDDGGWWAAAWLEAYAATGRQEYLRTAKTIHADMLGGWTDSCGGGILWRKHSGYKAAIANSLFIYVSAGLFEATGVDGYRDDATRCLSWFRHSGLRGDDGLVRDGLGEGCELNADLWTYNQGIFIGAIVRMCGAGIAGGGDRELLAEHALATARAAMDALTGPSGILREEGEPELNADRVQFKGILMRYLADLYDLTGDEGVAGFIRANAEHLWAHARDPGSNRIGSSWQGPFDRADAGRQGSALDALVAAAAVSPVVG